MCKETTFQPPEVFEKESEFEAFEDMTSPSPGGDLEKEINGFISTYQEQSFSCRLKVYFLGDTNVGKTSLVQSLVTEVACLAKKPTEGVNVCRWRPFKGSSNDDLLGRLPTLDEKSLVLDLWDMTGRKTCQGIHQMFLSRSLFVLVFNLADPKSCQQLSRYISAIQARVPGSSILLVGTRADKFFTKEDRKQKASEVLAGVRAAQLSEEEAIKNDITQISDLGADPKLLAQIEWLESLLETRPQIHPSIFVVSCKTGKGISDFRKQLVTKVLDSDLFTGMNETVKPELVRVTELLEEHTLKGSLLISWEEYRKITQVAKLSTISTIETAASMYTSLEMEMISNTRSLEKLGAICTFPALGTSYTSSAPVEYVCTSPQTLARLFCSCHVDDHRKIFRIDARKFWHERAVRPQPVILVQMLEEIAHQGMIREILLPLLWQEKSLKEEQIKRIIDLLIKMGLFAPDPNPYSKQGLPSDNTNIPGLVTLPSYPTLSQNTKHHAVLLNLLPDKKPHLNWSAKPFRGDVQVNWRFSFPSATPPGLTQCMLGAFHSATFSQTYTYQWRYGLLIKLRDVIICIEVDTVDLSVDVMCRVNADDPTNEVEGIEFLWAHLAPFVREAWTYLKQWPGLVFKIELVPFGSCFYQNETIGGDRPFLLAQCLIAAKSKEAIKFTDGGIERSFNASLLLQFDAIKHQTVEEWLLHILEERDRIIKARTSTPPPPIPCRTPVKRILDKNTKKATNTRHHIKWDLQNENSMTDSVDDEQNKSLLKQRLSSSSLIQSEAPNKQPDNAIMRNETGIRLGEPQLTKEATRVASGFVAVILAQAVAEYVRIVHEEDYSDSGYNEVSKSQVEAAKLASEAAIAAQTGDIEATARAVMAATQALQTSPNEFQPSIKSKSCYIL